MVNKVFMHHAEANLAFKMFIFFYIIVIIPPPNLQWRLLWRHRCDCPLEPCWFCSHTGQTPPGWWGWRNKSGWKAQMHRHAQWIECQRGQGYSQGWSINNDMQTNNLKDWMSASASSGQQSGLEALTMTCKLIILRRECQRGQGWSI